jgi:PTS system beta-glucosides-specific IIC component
VGDLLATVDLAAVAAAGYDTTTMVTITNTKALASVTPHAAGPVAAGAPIIDIAR